MMENENTPAISDGDKITLEGAVAYITYQNEQNGYAVCDLDIGKEEITVVGILPGIAVGETIRAQGHWENHSTYGPQFKVEYYEKELPTTAAAMERYLASGSIKGIGKKTAKKIVAMFGVDTFDVIENHPSYLTDIPGITPKKADEMSEAFRSQFGMRSVMMFCRDYFGPAVSIKIYKQFGSGAVEIIKQNPYVLCEKVNGIGFESADKLAESLEFDRSSDERIKSGLKYALSCNAVKNGHTFIPTEKLVPLAASILDVDRDRIEEILQKPINGLKIVNFGGTSCAYLTEYYDAEMFIAKKLSLLMSVFRRDSADDVSRLVEQVEHEEGIEYAAKQKKAIVSALENGVMVLTGGPGTGKTTVIRAIIRIGERLGCKVALAAPTGRAAKRMSEATSYEAKTVHRMLEVKYTGDEPAFLRDENNLLDEDLIIIDEASMVDTMLMSALLHAIKPGVRLVLIGDSDQLPSVGAGHILWDVIGCDIFPTVRLTEIFRQAQESRIVTNAHAINSGELPVLDDKQGDFFFLTRDEDKIAQTVADLSVNRLPRTYGFDVRSDIQVITPSHKGIAGTEVLNALLQSAINPPDKRKREYRFRGHVFREGDKVMQVKNNYDIEWERGNEAGVGIFNGDIGIIEQIDFSEEKMRLRFDDRSTEYDFSSLEELEHAYAITIHKSQGSEYPIVIIPMFNYSSKLMTRNLLYTAVTRAQKMVVLVGRPEVVQGMVSNNRTVNRYTGLRYLLKKLEL